MAEKGQKSSHPAEDTAHAPHSAEDWETLFEDPENGLIAMMGQAHSVDALELSTRSALTKLLVHEDERARLEEYEGRLSAIAAPDGDTRDVEQVRAEIIALLRRLKEDGKRAAEAHGETPTEPGQGKQTRKPAKKGPPLSQGARFSQINKIGIIVLSILLLLAAAVLAVYLRSPEMPAPERAAAIKLLLAHGESVRPDASWIIEKTELSDDGKFELVFQLTQERHLLLFRSFNAMKRATFAASLCPTSGALLDMVTAYERSIRIEIKEGAKILTSASCS